MTKDMSQKGAIMLEILAVLMLLGMLGPMLYRQVNSRNEELSNINFATELRTLKEGFLAYIIANHGLLCAGINLQTTFSKCTINDDQLEQYLPNAEKPAGFTFKLYAALQSTESNTKVYQGFVYPNATMRPTNLTLRRAARIANLIGADGGIYDGTGPNIYGALGAWETAEDDIIDEAGVTYLATTGMSYYTPEVTIDNTDYSDTTYFPEDLAFQRLHAWSTFSVGGKGEGNCYTTDVDSERKPNELSGTNLTNCDPLFWVDSSNVYVKNNLHIGTSDGTPAILLDGQNARITIKHIDTDGTDKTLTIGEGKIESAQKTPDGKNYQIDPAGTSIMHDIQLVSRGNAKLSQLLPNYIAKSVIPINKTLSATSTSVTETIRKPFCPTNYVRAIIITPTRWNTGVVDTTDNTALGFSIEIDGEASVFETVDNGGVSVGKPKDSSSSANWTITLGYKNSDETFTAAGISTKVAALAQTFCVWDVTNTEVINKYNPTSTTTTTTE